METSTVALKTLARLEPWRFRPFRKAAVLGAGTMGAQIAAHLVNAGLEVWLLDIAPPEGPKNAIVEQQFRKALALKPDPFFDEAAKQRIRLGNFEEHFDHVGEADWVIEAVVERLDIKRQVMARVEGVAREDAVISTNTSGLPIREIAEGRSETFRRRFLGTHFFNPPRYLKLLELIPTADTDPEVLGRVAHFARFYLGKSIVVAHDVPYFIANRIGVYGMMRVMRQFLEGQYTIEEIDALTGPLVGRPKSATFRTADLVGLDVMLDVARNLYEKVPGDENREAFKPPALLETLVAQGALGQKTGAGFYKKENGQIKSINPATGQYEPPRPLNLGDLERFKAIADLRARLRALYEDSGRVGTFFRVTTLDLLAYAAHRIPEITENPADVDRAMRWGFGWELGPFEIWDALGVSRVVEDCRSLGLTLPDWVTVMAQQEGASFYKQENGRLLVYRPSEGRYEEDPLPGDEIRLAVLKADPKRTLWKNEEAALLDLGDGVVLYEFRSKANALGQWVMQGLAEVIDRVENDPNLRGLVIGNEGRHFSVGANLGEVVMAVAQQDFKLLEMFLEQFQAVIQRVRYATKPVVVCVHQRALGGGCEMVMACPHPVAAAESYLGLVELGVGLIPAGTGTTRLTIKAAEQAPSGHPSEILPWIRKYFETIAMAQVATSARQAQAMGFLPAHACIVMHEDRRFHAAKQEVIRLSEQGYAPPVRPTRVKVLGQPGYAALMVGVDQYRKGGFITEYDQYLASKLAYVMTGGALTHPQEVSEDYLLALEREVFLHLLGQPKTQERILHLLQTNKPLRN
ncbi:3-hydroxyacyl-CoA dehydrogenase/enoyl-CoA hydratase family protein [Rhodothermus bifroesti]|uniref:3-hydroxyacyl-CoA dehydrogenase/enoyl-CoA hydratase family protein n=1 Tax=Rhodothermus marinus TaxID=29549 RepID=A0A7V2B153_RHOMR|nr:3-hydroxyacyl-CoA dehydrogenase/enoyl-CoA hydratase family protein [Rhodothermus bifroesti]